MVRAILKDGRILSAAVFFAVALFFAVQIDYTKLTNELTPLGCVAVACLAGVVQIVTRARGGKHIVNWSGAGLNGYLLYIGYVLLIRTVGLLPATPVFLAAVFLTMEKRGGRSLASGLVFGICMAAFIYLIFVVLMDNLLPMGIFE